MKTIKIKLIESIMKKAGKILLEKRHLPIIISQKKDKSPVCNVDIEASQFLTEEFSKNFKEHGIIDEEISHKTDKEFYWVIDPLDGTIEYLNRGENFGVLACLLKDNIALAGFSYKPLADEFVYAIKGKGAYLRKDNKEVKLKVSNSKNIDVLVSQYRENNELKELLKKINPTSVSKMPSSFKMIEVAKGNATLFLCPKTTTMNCWDLYAPSLMLEEAGGKITNLNNQTIKYDKDLINQEGVLASNQLIHKEVLQKLYGGKNGI